MKTILLIGSGRLALHLNHWFTLNSSGQSKLLTWDRHQDPHALRRYALEATHVWLAIADSAIVPFYEKYLIGHDAQVVHFSGSLADDRMIAAHPLMTFARDLYTDDVYSRIQFALTGAVDLDAALPGFRNSSFEVSSENKPLYHALCVVAGNFSQMLWSEVYRLAEKYKIPPSAFDLYLQQIVQNFIQSRGDALTGPFHRRDLSTIEKNAEALSGTHLQSIYQTFQKEFLK